MPSNFNRRPVLQSSQPPSPIGSTTSPTGRSPIDTKTSPTMAHPRRPMSPTSLRDVDLNHGPEGHMRSYPAPPTGHELMALFPPAPPAPFDLNRGTADCFRREERAFFAQQSRDAAVRVQLDLEDAEKRNSRDKGKHRDTIGYQNGAPLPLPQVSSSPQANNMAPVYPPHPDSRSRGPSVPVPSSSFHPGQQHQSPPNPHVQQSPPNSSGQSMPGTKGDFQPEDYRDDPDEAWRRPMPYAERRRAGKHTKRVIVRT